MNELVWEGVIEVLRGNQPSLKATARLWRRDDFFGSDWGGQLELPVVFRRLLPPGEYAVRLPSGRRASVRVMSGPSTTSMTFPTLTGIGHPPFGGSEARPRVEPFELDAEWEMSDEPAVELEAAAASAPRPLPVPLVEVAAPPAVLAAAPPEAAPTSAPAAPAPEAPPEASPSPVPVPVVPAPALEPRPFVTAAVETAPMAFVPQAVEQTEAMARAFLATVEARQRLQALTRPGFEGRAIESARAAIEAATAAIEGALRAREGADRWQDGLSAALAGLSWFANLAVPDADAEVAGAGRAVHSLVAVIEQLLAATGATATAEAESRARVA